MPITAGTYTIGGVGADYATLHTALNDISKGVNLTADITLNQIDSFDETVALVPGTIQNNSFKILIDNLSPHGGIFGVGNIITVKSQAKTSLSGSTGGDIEIRNLQYVIDPTMPSDANGFLFSVTSFNIFTHVHDILIDGNDVNYNTRFAVTVQGTLSVTEGRIENCITKRVGFNAPFTPNCAGYQGGAAGSIPVYVNQCSVHLGPSADDVTAFVFNNFNKVLVASPHETINDNIAYIDSAATNCTGVGGNNTDYEDFSHNNASTDNSWSGGFDSIDSYDPAAEFTSIDASSSDFLVPLETSQFKEAGNLSGDITATSDMRGNAYGANPPIGAAVANGASAANGSTRGLSILRLTRRQARRLIIRGGINGL